MRLKQSCDNFGDVLNVRQEGSCFDPFDDRLSVVLSVHRLMKLHCAETFGTMFFFLFPSLQSAAIELCSFKVPWQSFSYPNLGGCFEMFLMCLHPSLWLARLETVSCCHVLSSWWSWFPWKLRWLQWKFTVVLAVYWLQTCRQNSATAVSVWCPAEWFPSVSA